jgi:hypothetical protein
MVPLLIIDAANVVGSVPDGWWRDRVGAAERLRDRLAKVAEQGLPGIAGISGPVEVVLVVEGAAVGISDIPGVRVRAAPRSGDDEIVEVVRAEAAGRQCVVITADRGLRARVEALGATTLGPRSVRS